MLNNFWHRYVQGYITRGYVVLRVGLVITRMYFSIHFAAVCYLKFTKSYKDTPDNFDRKSVAGSEDLLSEQRFLAKREFPFGVILFGEIFENIVGNRILKKIMLFFLKERNW